MDISKQKSLLNTVNSIVNSNQLNNSKDFNLLAEHIEKTMQVFEEIFSTKLTEKQESFLIDHVLNVLENDLEVKEVNLNENNEIIMNQYSPEEVFLSLFKTIQLDEIMDRSPSNMTPSQIVAFLRLGRGVRADGTPMSEEEKRAAREALRAQTGRGGDPFTGTETTGGIYSVYAGEVARGQAETRRRPGSEEVTTYVNKRNMNEAAETKTIGKKHKKKVFKIVFMEGGAKKKGTAVSHKGVMRIISNKKHYKVYDEHNQDVTSRFRGKSKK